MRPEKLLEIIHLAEKLKNVPRHCETSEGRTESVAEHCWRICLMAHFMKDEFPDVNIDKVVKMCIFHDMGEIFTGDIPAFEKNHAHEDAEANALKAWVKSLPAPYDTELRELYTEMAELETKEAKLYKAIDNLEALIQHNESDISTWLPLEYDLQLTYGIQNCAFSEYTKKLRELVAQESTTKMSIDFDKHS